MVLSLAIIIGVFIKQSQSLKECTDERECGVSGGALDKIEDDGVVCSGRYSCADIPEGIISTKDIDCTGAGSCGGSNLDATGNVNCIAGWCCDDIERMSGDIIQCQGSYSCRKGGLFHADTYAICGGQDSCTIADGTKKFRVNGRLDCAGSESCRTTTNIYKRPMEVGEYDNLHSISIYDTFFFICVYIYTYI